MKNKKSLFISKNIRRLHESEKKFIDSVENIINQKIDSCIIAYLPEYVSYDGKIRPLILIKDIVVKIKNKHGKIPAHNLLINAHDWDYVIKKLDKNIDKINLIKLVPDSNNFLLIGAIRDNGFFILTHFETETIEGNELKSLLGRGDIISKDTRPGSLASSTETSSQSEGVSDVIDNDLNIPNSTSMSNKE